MNNKQYIYLWVLVQVLLLIIPISVGVTLSFYQISFDKNFIDIFKDTNELYEQKIWKSRSWAESILDETGIKGFCDKVSVNNKEIWKLGDKTLKDILGLEEK